MITSISRLQEHAIRLVTADKGIQDAYAARSVCVRAALKGEVNSLPALVVAGTVEGLSAELAFHYQGGFDELVVTYGHRGRIVARNIGMGYRPIKWCDSKGNVRLNTV